MKSFKVLPLSLIVTLLLTFSITNPAVSQEAESSNTLPSLDQILEKYIQAVGGRRAIEKLTSRFCQGKLIHDLHWRTPPNEVVPFEAYAKIPNKSIMLEKTLQGIERHGCDGVISWEQNSESIKKQDGIKPSKIAWLLNPQNALHLQDYFPNLQLQGEERIGNRIVYVVKPADLNIAHYGLYFDAETGLLLRIGYYNELQDYREVDGVMFPFRFAMSRKGGSSNYIFEEVKHNLQVDDAMFSMPEDN